MDMLQRFFNALSASRLAPRGRVRFPRERDMRTPDNQHEWRPIAVACYLTGAAWLAVIGLASIVLGRW